MKDGKNRFFITLENNLRYEFNDITLLKNALTHTSYANENNLPHYESNQRLEFLGDAVLDLIISEFLYEIYPQAPEGELTKNRAKTVCENTLAEKALQINLGEYLLLGKGEMKSGGRYRTSILADAYEAIIGAIYVDGGINEVKSFIKNSFSEIFCIENLSISTDYKTLLQEIIQKESNMNINYKIYKEKGPDHNKEFSVHVCLENKIIGSGIGKSKKEAEQMAAKNALEKIR